MPCALRLGLSFQPGPARGNNVRRVKATSPSRWAPGCGRAQQQLRRRQAAAGRGADDWGPPSPQQFSWDLASTDSDYDSDEDLDLFPEEMNGDPEFVAENLLALILIALSTLAVANILLKLLIVAYSLVSVGVRYTVVGLLLAVLLVQVQPGRWWF